MQIKFTETGYSREEGTFFIKALNEEESLRLEAITEEFNNNQYITPIGGDDTFMDFIYNKDGLDEEMIRKMWKEIK